MENALKSLRKSNGLTQKEVASYLGYSEQLISIWEKGSSFPDASIWGKICRLYHISLSALLLEDPALKGKVINEDFDPKSFSLRLLSLRKERGLTQSALADAIGINSKTIISFEKGKSLPSQKTFLSICSYFSISPEELYFGLKAEKPAEKEKENRATINKRKAPFLPRMAVYPLLSILLLVFFIPSIIPSSHSETNLNNSNPGNEASSSPNYDSIPGELPEEEYPNSTSSFDSNWFPSGDEINVNIIGRNGFKLDTVPIPFGEKPSFEAIFDNVLDEESGTAYIFQGFEEVDGPCYIDIDLHVKYKAIPLHDYLSSPYDFSFTSDGMGLTLNRFRGETEERFEIPSSILGFPVRVLNFLLFEDNTIKELIIPDTVTRIKQPIIAGSKALLSVQLSEQLEIVDNYIVPSCPNLAYNNSGNNQYLGSKSNPFLYCSTAETFDGSIVFSPESRILNFIQAFKPLTKVTLPKSVSYLSHTFLQEFQKSTSFEVEEGNPFFVIEDGCLIDKRANTLIAVNEGVTSLPQKIKRIKENALNNFAGKVLSLPTSLEIIEGSLSEARNEAEQVIIGSSLSSIYHRAFLNFPNITKISVEPDNPAFESCEGSLYTKGKRSLLFCPSNIKQNIFAAPEATERLGRYCFNKIANLKQIRIFPNKIDNASSLGEHSFSSCSDLELVEINISKIESYAFYDCPKLNNVVLGKGLISIESSAFEGCLGLESVYYRGNEKEWATICAGNNPFFPNSPKVFFLE